MNKINKINNTPFMSQEHRYIKYKEVFSFDKHAVPNIPKWGILFFSFILILFFFPYFEQPTVLNENKTSGDFLNENNSILSVNVQGSGYYSQMSPINCSDESELLTLAGVNGWLGSGQYGDPIIISGISINANYKNNSIFIENSKLYVIIKDSLFRNSISGIKFRNSSNIIIENCTIKDSINGIYILGIDNHLNFNITIKNSSFNNITERGIIISNMNLVHIESNSITNTGFQGMNVADSSNFIIKNNFINVSGVDGIRIGLLTGENRLIYNNSIYNCGYRGLGIEVTNNVNISHNLIMYNHIAFRFEGSGYINCTDNNFIYNDESAWIGKGGSYFTRNNFISYSKWQIMDESLVNDPPNIFIFNYWSGFIDEDLDKDGIYDHSNIDSFQSYPIMNQMGDMAPSVNLFYINLPISVKPVLVISFAVSFNNSIYTGGLISLEWSPMMFSGENDVDHYELFIRSEKTDELIPVNTSIKDLQYTIDTKKYDDGFYQFKLVAIDSNQQTYETNTSFIYFYNHKLINLEIQVSPTFNNIITDKFIISLKQKPFNPFSIYPYNDDFIATLYYSIDDGKTWIYYDNFKLNDEDSIAFAERSINKFHIPLTFIRLKIVFKNSLGFHDEWISERYFLAVIPVPAQLIILFLGIFYLFPLVFAVTSKIDYIERLSDIEGGGRFEYQVPDEKKIKANKLRLVPITLLVLIDVFYISYSFFNSIKLWIIGNDGMILFDIIIIFLLMISYITTKKNENKARLKQEERIKKARDSEGKIERDDDEIKLTLTQKIISFIYLKDVGKKKKQKRRKGKNRKQKESMEEATELKSFADKLEEYENEEKEMNKQ